MEATAITAEKKEFDPVPNRGTVDKPLGGKSWVIKAKFNGKECVIKVNDLIRGKVTGYVLKPNGSIGGTIEIESKVIREIARHLKDEDSGTKWYDRWHFSQWR